MTTLRGKTLLITGASRGIGLAIALRAARDGANVVIAAKSAVANPKLPGTIHSAAAAVEAAGGQALAVQLDVREFAAQGIAVNALWPRTVIATAAVAMLGDAVKPGHCRKPEIVADAAHWMLTRSARDYSGHFAIDEEVLRAAGVSDFERYAVQPGAPLLPDLFID